MDAAPLRVQMVVSEPWDFGSGPVEMSVLDAAKEAQWSVHITAGWPEAGDAILSCRYEGETFARLEEGKQVIANLTSKLDGQTQGLVGTVHLIA